MRTYRQISDRDRVRISCLKASGLSISAIARKVGFNKSSISREFKRNCDDEVTDFGFWEELNEWFPEDPVPVPKKGKPRDNWIAAEAIRTRKLRVWKANQIN